jgi:hydrogenase maturation protein HypF
MGRLFDAVAALCGLRPVVSYEGQAAVELEAACDGSLRAPYPIDVVQQQGGSIVIDPRETIRAVLRDLDAGLAIGAVAESFHGAIAAATADACARAAGAHGLERVVLSGGVFQNRRLLEAAIARIERAGLTVLVPERLPVNDGGISYGQAAIAACSTAGWTR